MTQNRETWAHVCDDSPPRSGELPDSGGPTAVIVTHGMGQPVPFQTLEDVANALRETEARAGRAKPEVCVRRVELKVDGKPEPFNRAELRVGPPRDAAGSDRGREVHLYEVYWAPIPEGKVSGGDVIGFLLQALWQNLLNLIILSRKYNRFMFGKMREYAIHRAWTAVLLVTVGVVLLSLLFINVAVGLVALVGLFNGTGANAWLTAELIRTLRSDILSLIVPLALFGFGFLVAPAIGRPQDGDPKKPSIALGSVIGWVFVALGVAALGGLAIQMGWHMAQPSDPKPPGRWLIVRFGLLWLVVLWITRQVRNVLVQYVGDVAAYVSSHTVNRFWQIRGDIFQAAMRVARAVYGAKNAEGHPAYGRVVVVGHSLGSLISYDMLNGALLEDYVAEPARESERAPASEERSPLGVARRTAALVTFGSPLDKIAYLFRLQRPRSDIVREVLSNSIQPLIMNPGFRPKRWINIYSWNDLISAKLDYFDPPGGEEPSQYPGRVDNLYDHAANVPLLAHNQYWKNPLLGKVLLEVLGVR